MNKSSAKGIVIGIMVCLCLGAAARREYWQDKILQPNQGWIEKVGQVCIHERNDGMLAYNVLTLLDIQQQDGARFTALNAELAAVKARLNAIEEQLTDPNTPKEEKKDGKKE